MLYEVITSYTGLLMVLISLTQIFINSIIQNNQNLVNTFKQKEKDILEGISSAITSVV